MTPTKFDPVFIPHPARGSRWRVGRGKLAPGSPDHPAYSKASNGSARREVIKTIQDHQTTKPKQRSHALSRLIKGNARDASHRGAD